MNPTANWIACVESAKSPTVIFGTSSDRIFTQEGDQAYFVTIAKTLPNFYAAPYVGMSYSEAEEKILFPFGVNIALNVEHDLLLMNDGRRSHVLVTRKFKTSNVTLMLIDVEKPRFGISIGVSFN